jgi:protein O-mannosyl-transferase
LGTSQKHLLLSLFLFTAVFAAYSPAIRGAFLWDDDAHVSQNQALTSTQGLRDIWLKPGAVQQYYPVTYTAFWIQYQLWGLNTTGYHVTNILLHITNALLLILLLSKWNPTAAWIAGFLFALHPVMVESVAWISELKNTLSTFFALLASLAFLKSQKRAPLSPRWYGVSFVLFACALLSKSVTAMILIAYLAGRAWDHGKLRVKDIVTVWPFLLTAGICGLFTLHMEQHVIGAATVEDLTLLEKGALSGHAFWFYLGKLLYPSPLIFIYPRWTISGHASGHLLYFLGVILLLGGLAWGRKRWGKLPFACMSYFLICLFPALGFVKIYPMRFSFVADHFQYLASLGVFTLIGWAIVKGFSALQLKMNSVAGVLVIGLLLTNLAFATTIQARKYSTSMDLWEHTLLLNPYSAIAHHNMGIVYADRQEWRNAFIHLQIAKKLDPTFPQTHLALAYLAVQSKRVKDARLHYEEAFRLGIRDPKILKDYQSLSS